MACSTTTLIPKKVKALIWWETWGLLNVVHKLITNPLAIRLGKMIAEHINEDQTGFLTLLLVGGGSAPRRFFWSVPKTVCASAMKLGNFSNHSLDVLSKFWLPTLRRGGSRAIIVEVLFAVLRVFRLFPPISALLRLAIATDDIHRNSYALINMWRHLVMLLEPPILA